MNTVIKRDGRIVDFDRDKIVTAIESAMKATPYDVEHSIAQRIAKEVEAIPKSLTVEEIQDEVEERLMRCRCKATAREYVRYRYKKEIIRDNEKTYDSILEIVEHKNQNINEENSNKNPVIAATQRDYIAGEVSKDITDRLLLPEDILEADREGIIHFHDKDYFIEHIPNCCLCNLEDILQNGTVINGTLIEKPHSFATACNIATQVMAQVASNQYGGQSESLSALAPFVNVSRQNIYKEVCEELKETGVSEEKIREITERRLRDEVKKGVQTIQYQINTLMTTNGQTPFVTIFMYLNEVEEGKTRDDLAMIIEEVIKQRYQGTKNAKGVWVTPAFPKLIYVLEEDNIHEDSKYWYLTELSAKCTAKRLVPDYISEKKMLELKVDENGEGHCYTPMGKE
jgi:ribonucleoside-triphosphate reductase